MGPNLSFLCLHDRTKRIIAVLAAVAATIMDLFLDLLLLVDFLANVW